MCLRFICLLSLPFLLLCCNPAQKQGEAKKLNMVATTGMIADALKNIAGDSAGVVALMGPGVDPHLYKATQGDLQKLIAADIIFYNGLHLEGKMSEIFEKMGRQKKTVALSDGLAKEKLLIADPASGVYDPHIWFDVALWADAVNYAAGQLQQADPAHAAFYKQNNSRYQEELKNLHQRISEQLATIPAPQRILITSHDAFNYFGRAYSLDVRGLQGISTLAEFGLQDISKLVNFIIENKINAIFVESSVSPKSIEAVIEGCKQKGHQVVIGGQLYSDAMGAAGTPAGTYTGMVEANVASIVKALATAR